MMAFRPVKSILATASRVEIRVKLATPDFGLTAKADVIIEVLLKATGKPIPFLPLNIVVNGERVTTIKTDQAGEARTRLEFFESGLRTIEAVPAEPEIYRSTFGLLLPSGAVELNVAAVSPQALRCNQSIFVGVRVNGRDFKTADKVLFPLTEGSVLVRAEYPSIVGDVYAIGPNTVERNVTSDTTFSVTYNAPRLVELQLPDLKDRCISLGSSFDVNISILVKDVCGLEMANVPLAVNDVQNLVTNQNGVAAFTFTVEAPGDYTFAASTKTPILASREATMSVLLCPPAQIPVTIELATSIDSYLQSLLRCRTLGIVEITPTGPNTGVATILSNEKYVFGFPGPIEGVFTTKSSGEVLIRQTVISGGESITGTGVDKALVRDLGAISSVGAACAVAI